jgi:hypothetical protein
MDAVEETGPMAYKTTSVEIKTSRKDEHIWKVTIHDMTSASDEEFLAFVRPMASMDISLKTHGLVVGYLKRLAKNSPDRSYGWEIVRHLDINGNPYAALYSKRGN